MPIGIIEECHAGRQGVASDYLHVNEQPAFPCHEGYPEKLAALRGSWPSLDWIGPAATSRTQVTPIAGTDQAASRCRLLQTGDACVRSSRRSTARQQGAFWPGVRVPTFTSPIRRYPDLLVHRGIKAVLNGEKLARQGPGGNRRWHCSMTERLPTTATRDVDAWSTPTSCATALATNIRNRQRSHQLRPCFRA